MSLNTKQNIVGICFILAFILPQEGLLLFVNPVLVFLCAYLFFDRKQVTIFQYLFCGIIFLSFLFNINETFSFKAFARALMIAELFLFFPFLQHDIQIKHTYIYVIFIYIFLSQIAYLINFSPAISFYETFYPYEGTVSAYSKEHLSTITIDDLYARRLGGLFHNPNQCARYLCVILIVFLLENKKHKNTRLLIGIIPIFIAIFITGSRTGLFTAIGILLYYLYFSSNIIRKWKIIVIPIVIISLVSIYSMGGQEYRSLDISSGLENSLDYKWRHFIQYIDNQSSIPKLLFGIFDDSIWSQKNGIFDSEYGTLICTYGILGASVLVLFYVSLFKRTTYINMLIFIVLLWAISSTIIFSFRMSFIFMFLLSKYTQKEIRINHKKQTYATGRHII